MKKTWTLLSLTLALYGANSFGGTAGAVLVEVPVWTGFYVGANAGYLWSASNLIEHHGVDYYNNPLFLPNSQFIGRSLSLLGRDNTQNTLDSFIGGGQIGYNSLILDKLVIGIEASLDGITPSSNTTNYVKAVTTPELGVTHSANISINKKLDYLGFVQGRLGLLLKPNVWVYGTGAFAYGEASTTTTYTVTSSQPTFLPVYNQTSVNDLLGGWAAGAGAEWSLTPRWSVKAEYLYYSLGPIHSYVDLTQTVATNPPTTFASAIVKTRTEFTGNTVRLGVNYHF